MRKPWWGCCVVVLASCGRIAQGGDDSVPQPASDCVYGQIATTNDPIVALASAGDTLYEVSATGTVDANTLSAIARDGTVTKIRDAVDEDIAAIGSSLAFIQRQVDTQDVTTTAALMLLDVSGTVTTIDSFTLGDGFYQLNSPSTDGAGALFWLRWATDPSQSRIRIMQRATDGSITTRTPADASVIALSAFVSDGDSLYGGAFNLARTESFGRIALDGSTGLTLANGALDGNLYDAIGIDDANLVYAETPTPDGTTTLFTAPKNGGTPVAILSHAILGQPIFLDHHVYFSDGSSITRVATQGSHASKIIASSSSTIEALTTDSCGVVYATASQSGRSSVYRATF